MFDDIDWDDIFSSFVGFYYFAQQYVYPGFTSEQVVASVKDGTIIMHIVNVAVVWFMMRFKRKTVEVKYVTGD